MGATYATRQPCARQQQCFRASPELSAGEERDVEEGKETSQCEMQRQGVDMKDANAKRVQ